MKKENFPEENLRYSRQIAVKEIGISGQQKLREGRVLIVGCGALGSMVAMQLAGAGVGYLGIVDFDKIDVSNLQRQFFFKNEEGGENKVDVLFARIKALNPDIKVRIYNLFLTGSKIQEISKEYDFIVDATDNPESKKMIGEAASKSGIGCCIGGVRDFEGQVMTFKSNDPRFEYYFGTASSEGMLPCSLGGVMGPAAALCASIQASEAIKYLTGAGNLLNNRILIFNLLSNSFKTLEI